MMQEQNYKKNLWKAIHDKCMDCAGDYFKEVEHCKIKKCPLHPYRFGMSLEARSKKKSK